MIEAPTVNAMSTIALVMAIEMMDPLKRWIHGFLDNAKYHHADLVTEWLARLGCRIKRHFIPAYCAGLDSIERLWGLMRRNVIHNKSHGKFNDFRTAALTFLGAGVPENWHLYGDSVAANFRIINPADFRVLKA